LPGDGGVDLQHLRRFAKARDVPHVVREAYEKARVEATGGPGETNSTGYASTGENLVDSSKFSGYFGSWGRGAEASETWNAMVAAQPSDLNSVLESSTTSKDHGSKEVSLSGQEQETTDSDASTSESAALSAEINSTAVLNGSATFIRGGTQSKGRTDDAAELFLILGSTNAISSEVVAEELSAIINDAVIFAIQVPRLAPTSQEQATIWSSQCWPTVYKKSNPFGPHPSIVSRTEQEIRDEVEKWMHLASEVACQAAGTGSGEAVGVVIVERENGIGRPVAVAGDARWVDWPSKGPGNVMAHAALRAIAMIADGVKAANESEQTISIVSASMIQPEVETNPAGESICDRSISTLQLESAKSAAEEQVTEPRVESNPRDLQEVIWNTKSSMDAKFMYSEQEKQVAAGNIFKDKPILDAERDHCDLSGTTARYLCHDLEMYCTHEPCVMCSMAILHSRFGKLVFQHRMPQTGGMCADGALGHGLFWRKELNWTLLAWQWMPSSNSQKLELAGFHA
jgi:tRNA-specific adenosine deaminase 3